MASQFWRSDGVQLTRRGLLKTAAVLVGASCAPQVPSPQDSQPPPGDASSPADWRGQWAELVAAAKREGKVGLFTTSSVGHRKWVEAFEAAFPGLSVQHLQLGSSDLLVPRITEERKASIYEFDVLVTSAVVAIPRLIPNGVLDPLRPLLFRPDVLDDKVWRNGFEGNWLDNEKRWGFAMDERLGVWGINTDQVQPAEGLSLQHLLDPKWKGKIIMQDPRAGATYAQMTAVRLSQGEEVLRRLIVDQQPFFTRDPRQVVEGLVRGRYAFGNNVNKATLREFQEAGVGQNVKNVPLAGAMHVANSGAVWAVNRAPHPNAAKLLINWLLTKEGQEQFSKNLENNSVRADVEPVDPVTRPQAGLKYFYSGPEAAQPELDKTEKLISDWLGIKN